MRLIKPLPEQSAYSLSRSQRLLTNQEFQDVYRNARRFANRHMVVLVRPNDCTYPRIGISIAKKNVRRAVERNRIRRVIRESFRHHQAELLGIDIVVVVHKAAEPLSNAELFQEIARQWQKLTSYYRSQSAT